MKTTDFLLVIFYMLTILIIGQFGNTSFLVPIVIIYSAALFFVNRKALYALYIIIITTNGIITRENYFMELIGVEQIIFVFTLFSLLLNYNRNAFKNPFINVAISVFIFTIIYNVYVDFKKAHFHFEGASNYIATLGIINGLLKWIPAILIILQAERFQSVIKTGILSALLFLSWSLFLSPLLVEFGYYTTIHEAKDIETEEVFRFNGFIGNGNANTLSGMLVLGIAYLIQGLNKIKGNILSLVIISVYIVGIGFTGSRQGIILLAFVFIIFLASGKTRISLQNKTLLLVFAVLMSLFFLQNNIKRLSGSYEQQTETEGSSNRVGKWIIYLEFMAQNPDYFITGAKKEIVISTLFGYKAAHNFFIQVLYEAGIFFFIWLIYIVIRGFMLNYITSSNLYYINVPMVAVTMFGSAIGMLVCWSFFLCLFYGLDKSFIQKISSDNLMGRKWQNLNY